MNLHYRGWADVKVERIQDTYETIGPEHYLDATLVWEDAFTAGLDLSIYCRNLFDNDSLLPRPGTGGGFMESFGVRYGLSATMVF